MNYYVARNGQTYGPYSEETLRKYLAEGSMLATDMARSDGALNWTPLGQLLAPAAPVSVPPPMYSAPPQAYLPPPVYNQPPAYTPPSYSPPNPMGGAAYPPPPSLHWALLLVIGIFFGLFITIWAFIQAGWVKSIDPASKATRDLIIAICFPIVGVVFLIGFLIVSGVATGLASSMDHPSVALIGSLVSGFGIFMLMCFGSLIFHLKAFFGMKNSIERYYNTVEPISLRLSGVMTFFFNVIYFQYHFTRIAEWKRTGVLSR
jgi:hypothetical protein